MDSTTTSQNHIAGLREQIKANAGLLFPLATKLPPQTAFDVVILTTHPSNTSIEKSSLQGPRYQALVTYASGMFPDRKDTVAAKGAVRGSVVEALEGLLLVLAMGLERFQGNLLKGMKVGEGVGEEGGMVDRGCVLKGR